MKGEKIKLVIKTVRHLLLQFFVAYGCAVMLMAIAGSSMNMEPVSYQCLFYLMVISAMGVLLSLILVVHTNVSERAMCIRWIMHFVVWELLIITAAVVLNVVTGPMSAIILFIEVAVIYLIVRWFYWKNDKNTSDKINEGLQKRKIKKTFAKEEL